MLSYALAALALVGGSIAAPTASPKSCGASSTSVCANSTMATSGGWTSYMSWNGTYTWNECRDNCLKNSTCQSFQYIFQPDNGYVPSAFTCTFYQMPVAQYQVPCSNSNGVEPQDNYWDTGCPDLEAQTSGTVPANPSNDTQSGTCNSGRTPITPLVYADQMMHVELLDQPDCQALCKNTSGCKSYMWQNYGDPVLRRSTDDTWQEEGSEYFPFECVLFTQPVSEITTVTGTVLVGQFYDINCPTSTHQKVTRRR